MEEGRPRCEKREGERGRHSDKNRRAAGQGRGVRPGEAPWPWSVRREGRSQGCWTAQAGGRPSSLRGFRDRRTLSLLTSGLTKGRWEEENGHY